MNRLQLARWAAWPLLGLALSCSGGRGMGDGDGEPVPADPPPRGAGTSGASGAAASAGAGGSQGSSSTGEPGGGGAGGRAGSGAGDVTTTAGNGGITIVTTNPPEVPQGEQCLGTRIDTQRHSASCGACEQACPVITIGEGIDWPIGIVLDATTAYWITSGGEGVLMSAPVDGSSPAVVLGSTQGWPADIAIDATHVYWTSGTIYKMPLAGGEATRLVPLDVYIRPRELAVDATHVYWTDMGQSDEGAVMKIPIDGGTPVPLATALDASPYGIAVDATHVYWAHGADAADRLVMKVPLEGGTPVALAMGTGMLSVFGFAIDATHAYFTTFELSSAVMRVPLAGGAQQMLATGTQQPMALAIDGARVYWTNASNSQTFNAIPGTDGTVDSVPLAGGALTNLGPNQPEPGGIAANGTTVCWTNIGAGRGSGTVVCLGVCESGSCR